MKKLTENLIQQRVRTCTTDIDKVLQINITGRGLQDVSLLRKMTGVEILSLSFNSISTLTDFQFCKNIKELYLRHNNVTDLNEICYLKKLPNLRLLMLAENPCSKDPLYRPTIIRNLKGLVELDGVAISLEERKEAITLGKDISFDKLEPQLFENYIPDGSQILRTPTPSNQKLRPSKSYQLKQLDEEPNGEIEYNDEESADKLEGKRTLSKESLNEKKSPNQRGILNYKNKALTRTADGKKLLYKEDSRSCHTEATAGVPSEFQSKLNLENFYSRVIPNNSNLLSATLKLLKELDYPSLQIINAEVTSRLDTFETEYLYKAV